jgi:hypothetical protein
MDRAKLHLPKINEAKTTSTSSEKKPIVQDTNDITAFVNAAEKGHYERVANFFRDFLKCLE